MNQIKLAQPSDIHWINDTYQKIDFVPSDLSKERVAIAEIDGEPAGLGRLVEINSKHAELGGMFVFDQFRNLGIARAIVAYLLSQGKKYTVIYCLPFAHLQSFYESCGFSVCENTESVPAEIMHKHAWCNQTYPHKVLLLEMHSGS